MQAQGATGLVRPKERPKERETAPSLPWRVLRQAAGMAVETLLITAVVMIVGHLVGALFGVENPADPRTPGGPTERDLEAFVAAGTVILGLIVSARSTVHGSLVIFAGALAFGITLPDVAPMAVIFASIGGINLGAWLVERVRKHRHHHEEPPLETQHQRRPKQQPLRPRHIVGSM